jgi:hypothetical protein
LKKSSKLIGEPQPNMEALYTKQLQRLSQSIQSDDTNPLNSAFQLLPSGSKFPKAEQTATGTILFLQPLSVLINCCSATSGA